MPPGLLDPLQLFFQVVDPIPEAPAVDLQLGLAGARAADPPRKPGETRVLPGEAGESFESLKKSKNVRKNYELRMEINASMPVTSQYRSVCFNSSFVIRNLK